MAIMIEKTFDLEGLGAYQTVGSFENFEIVEHHLRLEK